MRISLKSSLILIAAIAIVLNVVVVVLVGPDKLAAGDRDQPKVFAHYFPPYPISLDNAPPSRDYYAVNYLRPGGEDGRYAAVGGLLRDRPLGRSPLKVADFRLADVVTEVREAKAAGIDGFTLDILSLNGSNWVASINLMKAADEVGGFTIVPNLDVSAGMAQNSPDTIVRKLSQLYAYPSAEKFDDGDYMLSSFDAEAQSPAWWERLTTGLRTRGYPVKFIAVFLDASRENLVAFAPIVYGYGWWGVRTPKASEGSRDFAREAHELGRRWMEPVVFQDARPRAGQYAEAGNTELLRDSWRRAISQQADYVQLVTWNDYSESTTFAPSLAHGHTLLDANRLYVQWFKRGTQPAITKDHLFITYRTQPHAAQTTSGIMVMKPTLGGAGMAPRDTVEALTYLTAPAQVSVSVGGVTRTHEAPAGVSTFTTPLRAGSVSAAVVRGSRTVDRASSTTPVTDTPYVQDLQYWAAGD